MSMPRYRIFPSNEELLRTSPVLWACNLHRLPRRVVAYYVVALVVALLIWFRWPLTIFPIVFLASVVASFIACGLIVAQYSGIPNDEYVPTPLRVHLVALLSRFLALAMVMLVPMFFCEIAFLKAKRVSVDDVVADLNDLNIGALACDKAAYFPESSEDVEKLREVGLLTTNQVERFVADARSSGSIDPQKEQLQSLIRKYHPFFQKTSDVTELAIETTGHNALLLLRMNGTLGDGSRLTPITFYLDALLACFLIAFWTGVAGEEPLATAMYILMSPMIYFVPAVLYFLLFIVFPVPMPDPEWVEQLSKAHAELLMGLHLALLLGVYILCLTRLQTRPPDSNRYGSFSYALAYPVVPLVTALVLGLLRQPMFAVEPEATRHTLELYNLGEREFRVAGLLFVVLYLGLFSIWRRAGEEMRALPGSGTPPSESEV